MSRKYYIAYGSNLNISQMAVRCPEAFVYGIAEIKDYELLFKGSRTGAYITIEKRKGSTVPVAVWEVGKTDEKRLDRYEGYPAFYYKKEKRLNVQTDCGVREVGAFVYIMHEERELGIPSRQYIRTCLEGYDDFGFDAHFLGDALLRSGGKEHEENRD